MKVLFCAFLFCISFSMAKGQCFGDTASRIISSCDWSMRSGSFVSIDTNKIGRPCTCTVNSLFVGDLLVTSLKVTQNLCNTRVIVNNTFIFNCNEVGSSTFKVRVNDTLIVKAEHMSANITDNFTQCLGFRENGGQGGNLSVSCGTSLDSAKTSTFVLPATTPTFFLPATTPTFILAATTPTFLTTNAMQSNIYVIIALSAAGGIVLFFLMVVCSFVMLRRRKRNNKAESPEVHITLSYKVFDSSNELPDNPLYNSCQTVEEVESHVASKQNQQIASLQQTALNTMHRIDPDYDVPSNNKPIDQDASSMSSYEVSNTKSIKRDLLPVPMPLSAVPNNRFINRGPSPTPMYAVPQKNHERLPEVKDVDVNNQYYSTAKNPV